MDGFWVFMFLIQLLVTHYYEQNQCRGEPCVRPPNNNRHQTYVWKCMGFGLWFVSGYYSEGEHKVRPYIGFAHRLCFGLTCNSGYTQFILSIPPAIKIHNRDFHDESLLTPDMLQIF
jgi:hypothetical protein